MRAPIPVDTVGDVFWEGLSVTVCVSSPFDEEQKSIFNRLIDAWYEVGAAGGYGPVESGTGVFHAMFGPLFMPDGSIQLVVDMGSSPEAALDGLVHAFGLLREEQEVPIERVLLGEHADFADADEFDRE